MPAALPRPTTLTPVGIGTLIRPGTPWGGELRGADVAVTGVTSGTSFVQPGDLFAALPGRTAHGAAYAPDAVAAGAVAVLTDVEGAQQLAVDVPVLVVDDARAALGPISSTVYGNPSAAVRVLGVTGTSGKTTTTFLMRAGLTAAGRVPGLIGTVATMVGEDEIKTGFTTPEAPEVQALLAVMRERGVTDVAMEVSSHALTLGRVRGIDFHATAFTNLSEDHLDFHASMEDYFEAKASLLYGNERPVVVIDDTWGSRLVDLLGPCVTVSTAGSARGTWQARDIVERSDGTTTFQVSRRTPNLHTGGWHELVIAMGCAIPGRYNVANAVLALAMLSEAGVDPADAAPAISTATVPGRMERVDAGQDFLAVVDYSHKPAAVEGALRALRPLTRGRLIIVLGCGGDRDRGKRPHMGEIAARDADVLVVTDDNPRSEDPAAIRQAMLAGALGVAENERAEVHEIGDRAEAIAAAVAKARAGDTVLIAGKGHETGQEIAGVVHPFDDRDVLRAAIEALR